MEKFRYLIVIVVVAAKGMRKADILTENDPYCILYLYEGLNYEKAREKYTQITSVKQDCKNPEWNEDFEFEM